MADEKMVESTVQPEKNGQEAEGNGVGIVEGLKEQEFEALNTKLDQLNTVLDVLEEKNDCVHADLVEQLKSNRETRKEIQKSQKDDTAEKTSK